MSTSPAQIYYWWLPESSAPNQPQAELALVLDGRTRRPRPGQCVSWILNSPQTVGQEPPPVVAYGEVKFIEEVEDKINVLLKRDRSKPYGMSYEELCFCINAPVVGFHWLLGPIEGRLIGLIPKFELAGIEDTGIQLDMPADSDDDGPPVIWVDWSTIWTVAGLESMAGDIPQP